MIAHIVVFVFFFLSSGTSTKVKVRDAHRKIMVLNHPDKGELKF